MPSPEPLPDVPIKVKRLPNSGGLPLPAYASDGAAGMDVVAAETLTLRPGARHAVGSLEGEAEWGAVGGGCRAGGHGGGF